MAGLKRFLRPHSSHGLSDDKGKSILCGIINPGEIG
jgi:hypothetical protein